MIRKIFLILFFFFQVCIPKICWKECTEQNIIKSVDLVGCHRRSTYPHAEDFRCSSENGVVKGPPCTAKQGDTFKLHVEFVNLTISDMTQYAWWETKFFPYVDVPWATMESEACPYLDNGLGCNNNTMERGSKFLVMDIPVALLYPRGYYNIRHAFYERLPSGEEEEVACFRFNFKIV